LINTAVTLPIFFIYLLEHKLGESMKIQKLKNKDHPSISILLIVNWINMFTSTIMKTTVIQCCKYYVDPNFKSTQFHDIGPTLKF